MRIIYIEYLNVPVEIYYENYVIRKYNSNLANEFRVITKNNIM